MAQSALLKSSLAKKYWMAATGLFLVLFLLGHLSGNFQLFISGEAGKLQFNEYAVFMTTNPAVKILSYLTYASILFHAIDGLLLTIRNKKARPVKYAKVDASKNSSWSSRNMGLLGTILLVFIIGHMSDFWYEYKYGEVPYMETSAGAYLTTGELIKGGLITDGIVSLNGVEQGPAMKDLHEEVSEAFKSPLIVVLYVLAMIALAFHLSHGFSSGFQSFGLNHRRYTPLIYKAGKALAVIVPLGFASIPVYYYIQHL